MKNSELLNGFGFTVKRSDDITLTFSKQEARILQNVLELFLDEKKQYLQDNKTLAVVACNMYRNIKDARTQGE